MLTLMSNRVASKCDGSSRRDFLRVGALGMAGMTLPNLLRARAESIQSGTQVNNKSVIWLWLSGGPTHVETFDPKMTAPVEYRSMTGEAKTSLPGVTIGGSFSQMAKVADKMAFVRSFAHGSSSHGAGTQLVMTGYNDRMNMRPSLGSIVAKSFGTTSPITGMPTYVSQGRNRAGGPGWLGTRFGAFDPNGQARKNMNISVPGDRLSDRLGLLHQIDGINRNVDRSGMMEGMDGFEQQAFDLIMGSSQEAFDINKEDAKVRNRYGKGLGESLLLARRLCEAGCGFITLNYGGWDMHGGILKGMKSRGPQVDQGVSALIEDLEQRGMLEDTLLVITGEFGRTPKINAKGGRDHWGRLCTLALAGGGLKMGQVIGESSPRLEVPDTTPIRPQDLMATILRMYGIGERVQFTNNAGRPTYMIEDGQPIAELI